MGLMSSVFFGPVIVMVIITTIISPIFLKMAFRSKSDVSEQSTNSLVEDYRKMDEYNR